VVEGALWQINLLQILSHTGGVLHDGVSELMALFACRSFILTTLGFMEGGRQATPSDLSVLLHYPCRRGVVFGDMVEQGGFV
jgi:hypothetical protein